MKNMSEVTLSDLMSEDFDVWVSRNTKFGFNVDIDCKDGEPLAKEKGIHPYAADSLADFCRRYLKFYDVACHPVE
jgi:hypothetical protein